MIGRRTDLTGAVAVSVQTVWLVSSASSQRYRQSRYHGAASAFEGLIPFFCSNMQRYEFACCLKRT
jgi:hypothetical protein